MARGKGPDGLDPAALGALALWCLWVVLATVWAGRSPLAALPYLGPPVVLIAGLLAGRWAGRRPPGWLLPALLAVVAWFFVLGWVITPVPGKLPTRYPNANAAVGVQLMALVGLAALAQRSVRPRRAIEEQGRGPAVVLAAAALGSVLVLGLNASVAATIVAVPVMVATAFAVARRRGPRPAVSWLAGTLVLGCAAAAVVGLARRSVWPDAVVVGLDRVRKQLWSEALGLLNRHLLTGGGAGSFRETNMLSVDPDLASAHSWVLQVAAEFGLVGFGMFALVLALGLALAVRGSRAGGLIAAAAWTALGVHSTVDHLYEFAPVTFAAGAVLGWASASPQKSSMSPSVRHQSDAGGGVAASGRDVRSGPAPGTGSGTSPADGPVRRPMA